MYSYLFPMKEDILDIVLSDVFYKNYNTTSYINKSFCSEEEISSIIQKLPDSMSNTWLDIGIELDQDYDMEEALSQIENAFEYIKKYDAILFSTSIEVLVKSIHLLKTQAIYSDISFSDPNLPYTIFINLPNRCVKNWLERTVENIIHEAMHLQLSLLEKKINFYVLTDAKIYSPWKHEPRNNKGILHAIYVFSHLKYFWGKVYKTNKNVFVKQRIENIKEQLNLINFDKISDFYTEDGKNILKITLFD